MKRDKNCRALESLAEFTSFNLDLWKDIEPNCESYIDFAIKSRVVAKCIYDSSCKSHDVEKSLRKFDLAHRDICEYLVFDLGADNPESWSKK